MAGWRVDAEVRPDQTIHVWPEGDIIDHDIDGSYCVCGPALELQNGCVLVSHASLDGRELVEVA